YLYSLPLIFVTSVSFSFAFAHLYSIYSVFIALSPSDIYTLSLHDALPISLRRRIRELRHRRAHRFVHCRGDLPDAAVRHLGAGRSEEHTSELQSRFELVCRLLLEKKNIAV